MATAENLTPDTEEREREAYLREVEASIAGPEDLDDPLRAEVVTDHYLERLAGLKAEIARNAQIMTRRMAMIQAWEREVNGGLERQCKWLEQQIEAFARQFDYTRKKSRSLPNGTVGYRTKPATLEVVDESAALDFATTHGISEAIKVKVSLLKTPLLAHFKATGEIPEGCEYVDGAETFYIRAGG